MATSRLHAYGQTQKLTVIDRLGVWLTARRVRRESGTLVGKTVADFGCGYEAKIACALASDVVALTVVDVALAERVKDHPKTTAIESDLLAATAHLADASFDLILCLSVLEHLWEPELLLAEFRRLLAPGGALLINVPSWRGKRFLEFSAFRLGLSPADEMDDHKRYFDPRDLWPLLRAADFLPSEIRCHRYKWGLNTFATCRVASDGFSGPSP